MFTSSYWVDRILNTEGTIANPNFGQRRGFGRRRALAVNGEDEKKGGMAGRAVMGLLKLTLALGLLFMLGFIIFAMTIGKAGKMPQRQADGIVVLTGGEARIREGVRLLAAGKAKRLLISGVHAHTTRAQLARFEPEAKSLFECCIDIGREAMDTAGNAEEARIWAQEKGYRSLIVVTSSYHMPRSLSEFKRAMPRHRLQSYAVASPNVRAGDWWRDGAAFKLLFSEYMKYIPSLARRGLSHLGDLFSSGGKHAGGGK
jgi:uncharacterized SAM-binding protein YcdF (DUF218 family)